MGLILLGRLHILAYWTLFTVLHPGMTCGYACSQGLAGPVTAIVVIFDLLFVVIAVLLFVEDQNKSQGDTE